MGYCRLGNDEYTVQGTHSDRVSVRYRKTGEEFDVVEFPVGRRDAFSAGVLKEEGYVVGKC